MEEKLSSLMILDIMNMLCKCVVSGNVRRSATIAGGEYDDIEFMDAKDWEKYPERQSYCWLSNNSVIAKIGMDYSEIAKRVKRGEPGIIFLENAQKYSRMNGIIDYKDKDVMLTNPCEKATTKLLTEKGYITISEHVGEIVKVWNGEKWTSAEVKLTGHNQELFKCIFSDGSMLECTPNHKFILEDGTRKELQDLLYTDKLKKYDYVKCNDGDIELDDGYDRGFFCGDGYKRWNPTHKSYTNMITLCGEKTKLKPFLKYNEVKKTWYTKHKCICENIILPKDYDKNFVPLFNYTLKTKLDYLAGILDSDGNLSYTKKAKGYNNSNGYIRLHSINYDYLYNVKLLINSLGVDCGFNQQYKNKTIKRKNAKGEIKEYHYKTLYELKLNNPQILKLKDLGLNTHRLKINKLKKSDNENKVYKNQPLTLKSIEFEEIAESVYCEYINICI